MRDTLTYSFQKTRLIFENLCNVFCNELYLSVWAEKNSTEQKMNLTTKTESEECVTISNTEILKSKKLCRDIIPKKPGIYKIINLINGKYYVGSSMNLFNRVKSHFIRLKNGKHSNDNLQRSYNLHGGDNFYFKIVKRFDEISLKNLLIEENTFLSECMKDPKSNYNLCYEASGSVFSDETRKKLSDKRKSNVGLNVKLSKHLNEINKSRIGSHLSDEHKNKLRLKSIGVNRSEQTKSNLSKALTGLKKSTSHIEKIKLSLTGRKIPMETVLKIRDLTVYNLINENGDMLSDTGYNLRVNHKIIVSVINRRGKHKGWSFISKKTEIEHLIHT